MGTLRQVKLAIKTDLDLRKLLLSSSRYEIILDIDEDRDSDIIFLDSNGDSNIDIIGVDVFDTGNFNLYIEDTNHNGVPNTVLIDKDGNGDFKKITSGQKVDVIMIEVIRRLSDFIAVKENIVKKLVISMKELDKEIKQARRIFAKRD